MFQYSIITSHGNSFSGVPSCPDKASVFHYAGRVDHPPLIFSIASSNCRSWRGPIDAAMFFFRVGMAMAAAGPIRPKHWAARTEFMGNGSSKPKMKPSRATIPIDSMTNSTPHRTYGSSADNWCFKASSAGAAFGVSILSRQ